MKALNYATAVALTLLSTSPALAQRSTAFGQTVRNSNVTEMEVQAAQEAWGKALVQISRDFDSGGIEKATQTANAVLDAAYGYNMGPVLFKPTLTHGEQTFRTTREGALAYFVGGSKTFPDDSGFALKGWEKYEYKNAGVIIDGDMAITMGNVYLYDRKGQLTKVDKTWAFRKDDQGKLRIVLHHSSLPYTPEGKK